MKRTGFLILACLILAACGRDRGTESDPYGQSTRVGYDYNYGQGDRTSSLPGIGAQPLGGNSFGLDTISGDNADGSLSRAQTQALQQYIANLSEQDRANMQSVLLNNLRQCTFPPAGASTVASCRAGSGAACANTVSGYAMGYLLANAKRMNFSGLDVALMNQLAATCAAVDINNPTAVQQHLSAKSDSCKQGSKMGCGELLIMLARLFMKALSLAFGILKSAGISL